MRIVSVMLLLMLYGLTFAQHVTDDTAYYTPLPHPNEATKSKSLGDEVNDSTSKIYYLSIQSGYMFGCGGCDGDNAPSSSFSIINGARLGGKGRVGLGVGYDSYWRYQALPIFGSVSWDLFGNRNTNALVAQLNYGQSIAWVQKAFQSYGYDQTNGGRMLSPQIGCRLKYHDVNFSLLAGVKMQRVFTYYKYPTWTWMTGVYKETYNTSAMKQDISRFILTLMIGWR